MSRSSNPFEPSARPSGDGSVELTFVEPPFWFLENEFGVPSDELVRGLGGIVGDPFRLAARRIVHEPHDAVGGDDIGTGADQGRVGLELLGDVNLGVARIEDDQDLVASRREM